MVARARGLSADVLVVGAGPTGLAAALQAHLHGARVRVVERRTDTFRPSRAMIVHSRTLEVLRPLGVAGAVLERGDTTPRAVLHLGCRDVPARLGEAALRDTAYPHLTLVPQAVVEEVLADALAARGVDVERGTELVDLAVAPDRAEVTLVRDGRPQHARVRYVAGCDGAGSTVRRVLGVGWPGAPYREEVVLADLELDGALTPGALHVVPVRRGVVFLFALQEGATWRLLATRTAGDASGPVGAPGEPVPAAEVRDLLPEDRLGATVREVRWSARVRLQHRLADSFRVGPVLLAGDAAHSHSPAAAQGMNTGLVDAVSLGWRLGLASRHASAHPVLLDSYGAERRPAARQALALTHAVFWAEASSHPVPALLRGTVVPMAAPALPVLLRSRTLMAVVVRLLSQGWVRYRDSALSVEGVPGGPGPRPGDRLPDSRVRHRGREVDLHALTAGPGVHVLLAAGASEPEPSLTEAPYVTVHRIESWPGRGLSAVRPDGHVGLRSGDRATGDLARWLDLVGAL